MLWVVYYLLEVTSMGVINVIGRPSFTIPFFVPLAFIAGRQEMLSIQSATLVYGSLITFLAVASLRKPRSWKEGKLPLPFLQDPDGAARGKPDLNSSETTEWLNGLVRNLWLRYPEFVGEVLRKFVLDEAILGGLRRDKVLPAGPIKDVQAKKITLKKASPWVMRGRVNEMRSKDEMCVTATIRFVSDEDAGVELAVVLTSGISIPIRVENISIETELIFRIHLQDKEPYARVIWISMTEMPNLDLSIIPMGLDVMQVPGLDVIVKDLIMTGIKNEIVLPIGKIVPIPEGVQDVDYYKEFGAEGHPTYARPDHRLDGFVGKLTMFVDETKVMVHPQHHEGGAFDLYLRATLGDQVWRTHKISNTFHEKMHERFQFFYKGDEEETIVLELLCKQDIITYDPIPLGKVKVSEVMQGAFSQSTWVDCPAITNCKVKLRFFLRTFRQPLKSAEPYQFNPASGQFIGGGSDYSPEVEDEEPRVRKIAVKTGTPVRLGRGAPPPPGMTGTSLPSGAMPPPPPPDKESTWDDVLPRRTYKGFIRVTVHEAKDLVGKIIGTRDPYVKLRLGDQAERSSAKVSTTAPAWEETLCMFVQDDINDELQLSVLQNDVAMGRHIIDDAIGKYVFGVRQLIDHNKFWSGWITLHETKQGKVRLTLKYEELPSAVVEAQAVVEEWDHGLGVPVTVSERVNNVVGFAQVKVLQAKNLRWNDEEKNKDKVPHPFVSTVVSSPHLGELKGITRTVRGESSPIFREYFEFVVRDINADKIEVRVEHQDTLFADRLGTVKVPLTRVYRGEVLQEWFRLRDGSAKGKILLEIRLAMVEWKDQDPNPTVKYKELARKPRDPGSASGSRYDDDDEWALIHEESEDFAAASPTKDKHQ